MSRGTVPAGATVSGDVAVSGDGAVSSGVWSIVAGVAGAAR